MLKACGGDLGSLRGELDGVRRRHHAADPRRRGRSRDPADARLPARHAARGVPRAVLRQGKEVTGANVLVAIFSEQESQAVYFLKQQNIARLDVVNYITHGISKVAGDEGAEARRGDDEEAAGKRARAIRAGQLRDQPQRGSRCRAASTR